MELDGACSLPEGGHSEVCAVDVLELEPVLSGGHLSGLQLQHIYHAHLTTTTLWQGMILVLE